MQQQQQQVVDSSLSTEEARQTDAVSADDRPRRGPSKRRRPPPTPPQSSDGVTVVSRRHSSSSSAAHDGGNDGRDFVDDIIFRMKRSAAETHSPFQGMLSAASRQDQDNENRKRAISASMCAPRMDTGGGTWCCLGCGTADPTRLQQNSDSSCFVCVNCGTVDGRAVVVANPFEKTTGHEAVVGSGGGGVVVVAGARSAKEMRDAQVAACATTTRVAGGGGSSSRSSVSKAHAALARAAAVDAVLTAGDQKRFNTCILAISQTMIRAGVDAEHSPLFRLATRMTESAYTKSCAHASLCKCDVSTCPGRLSKQIPKHIAREALFRSMSIASRDAKAKGAFDALDRVAVHNQVTKITALSDMTAHANNEQHSKMISELYEAALAASAAAVSTPCPAGDDGSGAGGGGSSSGGGGGGPSPPPPDAALSAGSIRPPPEDGDRVQAFVERVCRSIQALASIGATVDEVVSKLACEHLKAPSNHAWAADACRYSADTIALLVCKRMLSHMEIVIGIDLIDQMLAQQQQQQQSGGGTILLIPESESARLSAEFFIPAG